MHQDAELTHLPVVPVEVFPKGADRSGRTARRGRRTRRAREALRPNPVRLVPHVSKDEVTREHGHCELGWAYDEQGLGVMRAEALARWLQEHESARLGGSAPRLRRHAITMHYDHTRHGAHRGALVHDKVELRAQVSIHRPMVSSRRAEEPEGW